MIWASQLIENTRKPDKSQLTPLPKRMSSFCCCYWGWVENSQELPWCMHRYW